MLWEIRPYCRNSDFEIPAAGFRGIYYNESSYTQADMTFKKTRKNALKKRKYAVLTVYHRKNAVFTNF